MERYSWQMMLMPTTAFLDFADELEIPLTVRNLSHNPEVAGSNPAPETTKALVRGPFVEHGRRRYRMTPRAEEKMA
jgi:hypothetical protein